MAARARVRAPPNQTLAAAAAAAAGGTQAQKSGGTQGSRHAARQRMIRPAGRPAGRWTSQLVGCGATAGARSPGAWP
jgi:hypothetical protein